MTWDKVVSILNILTSLLTIGTLVFIWVQTREITQQTRHNSTTTIASLYEQISTKMMDINQIFLTAPELRPYFYENKSMPDPENEKDYQRVVAVAETFLDFMDLVMVLRDISGSYRTETILNRHLVEWDQYFQEMYITSPAIRSFVKEHMDWWSENLLGTFANLPVEPNGAASQK